jgi:transposase InsO family protein
VRRPVGQPSFLVGVAVLVTPGDRRAAAFHEAVVQEHHFRARRQGSVQAGDHHDVHWLQVTVDPCSREVFSWQRMTVPANRDAVPAP